MEKHYQRKLRGQSDKTELRLNREKHVSVLPPNYGDDSPDKSLMEVIDALQKRSLIISEGEVTFDHGRVIKGKIHFRSSNGFLSKVKIQTFLQKLSKLVGWIASLGIRIFELLKSGTK